MKIHHTVFWLVVVVVLAAALTGFYFVHESLPKSVRAPTSLLLAPVAIVDGTCYALGVPGIYGKAIPVLVVNTLTVALACGALLRFIRWWKRRTQAKNAKPGPASSHGGM
ncbi:MAG: hypothetical protein ABL888_17095 [Pirellulaceae bacterium]